MTKNYQVDKIRFEFENCEGLTVDFDDIKKFTIKGFVCGNKGTAYEAAIVLSQNADVRYVNVGYDSGLTKFQRILKCNDIVSITTYEGESTIEYELEYEENDYGENKNQKCQINTDGDLIIEIKKG